MKINRHIVALTLVLAMLAIAGCTKGVNTADVNTTGSDTNMPAQGNAAGDTIQQSAQAEPGKIISSQELSVHNAEKDCWIVYSGKVYDITKYIPLHIGGPAKLVAQCGNTGFEDAALAQHGASKVAEFMLKPVLVGAYGG